MSRRPVRRALGWVVSLALVFQPLVAVPLAHAQQAVQAAQVRGVLLDQQGLPAVGYQVAVRNKTGDLFTSSPSLPDGTFSIVALPPDTYRLAAFAPDGTEFPILSREVTLKPGQVERVEIRLGTQGKPPGRAPAPVPTTGSSGAAGGGVHLSKGVKIGLVVAGAFAVAAAIGGGGGGSHNNPPVSPSAP